MAEPDESAKDVPAVDRRVARTRRALRQALFQLIQEKGYDAISVEEIARRADLGRTTFYLHYRDKEDLLLDEFVQIANERVGAVSRIPLAEWLAAARAGQTPPASTALLPLLPIFQHAAENAGLYRVLLRGSLAPRFAERVRELIGRSVAEVVQAKMKNDPMPIEPHIPLDLLGAYFAGALQGSLAWWLDQPEPPAPEAMALMFQQLFFPGAGRALGL